MDYLRSAVPRVAGANQVPVQARIEIRQTPPLRERCTYTTTSAPATASCMQSSLGPPRHFFPLMDAASCFLITLPRRHLHISSDSSGKSWTGPIGTQAVALPPRPLSFASDERA